MIASYVQKNQNDWDVPLPLLTAAYRSCEHETTGYTPNRLMLGREVFLPIQLTLGSLPQDSNNEACVVNEYVADLQDKMHDTFVHVREHLQKAQNTQKRDYDSRIAVNNYAVGDMIYVLDSTKVVGLSPKLCSNRWKGPQLVTRKISELLFEVKASEKGKTKILHHNRLKPYHGDDIPEWIGKWRKNVSGNVAANDTIIAYDVPTNQMVTPTNVSTPQLPVDDQVKRPRGRPRKHQPSDPSAVAATQEPLCKNTADPASGIDVTDGATNEKERSTCNDDGQDETIPEYSIPTNQTVIPSSVSTMPVDDQVKCPRGRPRKNQQGNNLKDAAANTAATQEPLCKDHTRPTSDAPVASWDESSVCAGANAGASV